MTLSVSLTCRLRSGAPSCINAESRTLHSTTGVYLLVNSLTSQSQHRTTQSVAAEKLILEKKTASNSRSRAEIAETLKMESEAAEARRLEESTAEQSRLVSASAERARYHSELAEAQLKLAQVKEAARQKNAAHERAWHASKLAAEELERAQVRVSLATLSITFTNPEM